MDGLPISITPEQAEAIIHWAACDRMYAARNSEDPSPAVQQLAGQVEAAIGKLVEEAPRQREIRLATECIMVGCHRKRVGRGLCMTCYQSAKRRIVKGKTTWEELIAKGEAMGETS